MSPKFRFQIISDLHLETPLMSPSYSTFHLPIHAPNLFLLGDTGLTSHPQLFTFLSTLLHTHTSLRIFYILGNHEAYHTTLGTSIASLSAFEAQQGPQRFTFMNRRRIDISPTLTILGCTLWTHIPPSSSLACANSLTDFNEEKGIWARSVEQHNIDHATDLSWLNATIASIPLDRQVIVLTHHSPTIDPRANHPRHGGSSTNAGFRSDLSAEECWRIVSFTRRMEGSWWWQIRRGMGRGTEWLLLLKREEMGGWRVVIGEKEEREGSGRKGMEEGIVNVGGCGDELGAGAGAGVEGKEMKSTAVKENPTEEKVGEIHLEPKNASRWRTAMVKIKNSLHKS
ncbi:hypothetical protein HBH46_123420 [Parastagonospora nodorum]|nr:hypothetical protein HBH46_123420 [Parastagonospora nodorum]KAH6447803.1 hypothetical protein HBI57_210010 [Parastagonospora nodorum]KAH6472689.1 hypothetical protein HBI58_145710 [Parastagonospora nodorum]